MVAEIWRSYHERRVKRAILEEKNRRLELELKLREAQVKSEASIFTASEEKDFQYIYSQLSREIKVSLTLGLGDGTASLQPLGTVQLKVPIIYLISLLLDLGYSTYSKSGLIGILKRLLMPKLVPDFDDRWTRVSDAKMDQSFLIDLRRYALTRVISIKNDSGISGLVSHRQENEFTEKVFRFRYWLGYNNISLGEAKEVEYTPAENL